MRTGWDFDTKTKRKRCKNDMELLIFITGVTLGFVLAVLKDK